jgi:uncharacterized protein YdhG (YjbR/CyaY superfamily)
VLAFKDEFAAYKNAKGAVQFLLNQPIPYALIERIVKFRIEQNLTKNQKLKSSTQLYQSEIGYW